MLKNNLFSLILLVFSVVMLTGCASIDYSRFIYPSGEINDRIVIEIDPKALNNCSLSKDDLYRTIVNDLENNYVEKFKKFIVQVSNSDNFTTEEKSMVINGINYDTRIIGNAIYCDVKFSSMEVFNLFYGSDDEDGEEPELREGTFINEYVQYSQNAYSILKEDYLKTFINKYVYLFNGKYNLNDVKLTQVYASPNTSIHSNADVIETSQGIKMHQWEIDASDLDFELEFYTMSPNSVSWYILALFLSLAVTFVVWGSINKRKMKK